MTRYNTYEMIQELASNRGLMFRRVGDEDFIVCATETGGMSMNVDYKHSLPFQILNYLHEYWELVEQTW